MEIFFSLNKDYKQEIPPKNKQNKDKFFEYIFNDSDKISGVFGQQPPVMPKREELRINEAREEWEKLLTQRWRQTKEIW